MRLPRTCTRTNGTTARAYTALSAFALAASVALACAAPADGQIAWDTPRMIGPESPAGFGAYWTRAGALPGDGDAGFLTLALPGTGGAVMLRGGAGEGAAGEPAGFGGIDVRASLARHSDSQPLDLAWNTGAGVGVGEYMLVSVPVGLSAGRSWSSGSVWLAPWVGAGVALEFRAGDEAPEDEFVIEPTAEFGVDLSLDASRRFVLRAAAALGDRQAVAVGLAIAGAR